MNTSQELRQLSGQVEGLSTRVNDTIKSAKTAMATADDYVRENPWIAIGVIAGVAASLGFLAGYMAAPQRSWMGMLRR
jgi:ElaB/YqjD/DUF883 family membrane-anchored ribosome-binding protein